MGRQAKDPLTALGLARVEVGGSGRCAWNGLCGLPGFTAGSGRPEVVIVDQTREWAVAASNLCRFGTICDVVYPVIFDCGSKLANSAADGPR